MHAPKSPAVSGRLSDAVCLPLLKELFRLYDLRGDAVIHPDEFASLHRLIATIANPKLKGSNVCHSPKHRAANRLRSGNRSHPSNASPSRSVLTSDRPRSRSLTISPSAECRRPGSAALKHAPSAELDSGTRSHPTTITLSLSVPGRERPRSRSLTHMGTHVVGSIGARVDGVSLRSASLAHSAGRQRKEADSSASSCLSRQHLDLSTLTSPFASCSVFKRFAASEFKSIEDNGTMNFDSFCKWQQTLLNSTSWRVEVQLQYLNWLLQEVSQFDAPRRQAWQQRDEALALLDSQAERALEMQASGTLSDAISIMDAALQHANGAVAAESTVVAGSESLLKPAIEKKRSLLDQWLLQQRKDAFATLESAKDLSSVELQAALGALQGVLDDAEMQPYEKHMVEMQKTEVRIELGGYAGVSVVPSVVQFEKILKKAAELLEEEELHSFQQQLFALKSNFMIKVSTIALGEISVEVSRLDSMELLRAKVASALGVRAYRVRLGLESGPIQLEDVTLEENGICNSDVALAAILEAKDRWKEMSVEETLELAVTYGLESNSAAAEQVQRFQSGNVSEEECKSQYIHKIQREETRRQQEEEKKQREAENAKKMQRHKERMGLWQQRFPLESVEEIDPEDSTVVRLREFCRRFVRYGGHHEDAYGNGKPEWWSSMETFQVLRLIFSRRALQHVIRRLPCVNTSIGERISDFLHQVFHVCVLSWPYVQEVDRYCKKAVVVPDVAVLDVNVFAWHSNNNVHPLPSTKIVAQSILNPPLPVNELRCYIMAVVRNLPQTGTLGCGDWYDNFESLMVVGERKTKESVCIYGDGCIALAGGGKKKVRHINVGDYVEAGSERIPAKITCISEQVIDSVVEMCHVGRCWVTVEHPVRVSTKSKSAEWVCPPTRTFPTAKIFIDRVYNFAVDQGHSVWVDGIECITLAHNFHDPAVRHPIWGTNAIIEYLRAQPGFPRVVFEKGAFSLGAVERSLAASMT